MRFAPFRVGPRPAAAVVLLALAASARASAQRRPMPTTRATAVASALSRSPLVALATSEQSTADAVVGLARQWENPVVSASVSKSSPQQHYAIDVPFDPWWQRSPRIGAATAAQRAAVLRYQLATRSIAFDADTAYTRAQLALARSALSTRTARDADSLLILARIRRDAGDASELDVELASVFAGQAHNVASNDSVQTRMATLALQTVMGLASDSVDVQVADSLMLTDSPMRSSNASLIVDAAAQDVQSAGLRVDAERQRRFGAPTFSVGVEAVDPGGQRGALATAGVSIPLPLFNRNQSSVALASADLQRSQAQLAFARLTTTAAILAARRDAESARARANRSALLVASADRISALSLLAYREGASTLLVVLEAQRTARDILGQYFDDVAIARNAASLLELLLSPSPDTRP